MPVGGTLDPVPVDFAVLLNIGQPRDFRVVGMPVLDQRMLARQAEASAESRDVACSEFLVAEDQDRMLGEGIPDPIERVVVQAGQIDPERFGAERLTKRTQFQRSSHSKSSL